MDCLGFRRSVLTNPRERTRGQQAHVSSCADCRSVSQRLRRLERNLQEAALVPVPDALAARVLLAPRAPRLFRYAAAAIVTGISTVAGLLAAGVVEPPGLPFPVEAVGPAHPAVAAIAEVMDEDGKAMAAASAHGDAELQHSLRQLGARLNSDEATAYYLGKCHIGGSRQCEHIVLSTGDAYANVMLVPDYPLRERVLVTDRHWVALVSPVGAGGYIVVADSAKTAKRIAKLIVKG